MIKFLKSEGLYLNTIKDMHGELTSNISKMTPINLLMWKKEST